MSTLQTILSAFFILFAVIGSGCDQSTPSDKLTELSGTGWKVEGIPRRVKASMVFGKDGKLTGFSGCNRFFAQYKTDGEGLNVNGIGGTRKLCPDVEMSVERELLKTLEVVDKWQGTAQKITLTAPVNQTKIQLARDIKSEQ